MTAPAMHLPLSLAELGGTFFATYWQIVTGQTEINFLADAAQYALDHGDKVGAAIALDKAEQVAERIRPLLPIYAALFAPLNVLTEGVTA